MATDRFPDLPAILERLPEAKRAELWWTRYNDDDIWYNETFGLWLDEGNDEAETLYHYAVLAVVLVELYRRGELPEYDVEAAKWVGVTHPHGDEVFFDSIFTAAAAAYLEVCK